MPELPEVETICRQLEKQVVGQKIIKTEVFTAKIINAPVSFFIKKTTGSTIKSVNRRAKLIAFELSNGGFLLCHLKLNGHLTVIDGQTAAPKYMHVLLHLSNDKKLIFDDFRKFGYVKWVENRAALEKILSVEKFGPEPLEKSFTVEKFKNAVNKRPNALIKPLLMDQIIIAGVGNVYSQEACFYAKINPQRKIKTLAESEIRSLYKHLREILEFAIKKRGTSVDAYLDTSGKPGEFQKYLKVYGRAGKPCVRRDGGVIQFFKMAGRGTCFCPKCQK